MGVNKVDDLVLSRSEQEKSPFLQISNDNFQFWNRILSSTCPLPSAHKQQDMPKKNIVLLRRLGWYRLAAWMFEKLVGLLVGC